MSAATDFQVRALVSWARHYNRVAVMSARCGLSPTLFRAVRDLNMTRARALLATPSSEHGGTK